MSDETDSRTTAATSPHDVAEQLNAGDMGWSTAMGVKFVEATEDRVVAKWDVRPEHLQVHGIVHGGVHAGVIETVCSVGAWLAAQARRQTVVGLENHTTFIRAVKSGSLRATALPLTRGRRTQVWEARIEDDERRLVASGRVRLLCLEADVDLGAAAPKSSRES
jgi:uncharacterized protein (TIGR00369 family)